MQSTVTVQLVRGGGRGGGGLACCGVGGPVHHGEESDVDEFHSGRGRRESVLTGSSPSPVAAAFPQPRFTSPPHQPPHGANKSQQVRLGLKRMVLARPPSSSAPVARTGQPRDEQEDAPPVVPGKENSPAEAASESEIDMRQFKAVRLGAGTSGGLHAIELDFWPRNTYKLKVASAVEARVWCQVFQSYGEYTEYGGSAANEAKGAQADGAVSWLAQRPAAAASSRHDPDALCPYFAYSIPPLYACAFESCCAYLRTHRAYRREGLFRTGKSSALILKQILLNDGRLEGGTWQRPAEKAGEPTLDLHVIGFIAKNVFRSLPETILTNALILQIMAATKNEDVPLLIRLLHHLPPTNQLLLQTLFEVMWLTLNSPSSRMTAESLAKVVGPNLLPKDDATWLRSMTAGLAIASNGDTPSPLPSLKRGNTGVAGLSGPPPAGSIPMRRFFELVFEHLLEVFPTSTVLEDHKLDAASSLDDEQKHAATLESNDTFSPVPVAEAGIVDIDTDGDAVQPYPASDVRIEELDDASHASSTHSLPPSTSTSAVAAYTPVIVHYPRPSQDDATLAAGALVAIDELPPPSASRITLDESPSSSPPVTPAASAEITFTTAAASPHHCRKPTLQIPTPNPRPITFERELDRSPRSHNFPTFHGESSDDD